MNSARQDLHPPFAFGAENEALLPAVAREITAARLAQARWAATPIDRRLRRVRELRHLIAEHARELAESSAAQRGRAISESLTAEVLPLAEACRFVERNGKDVLTPQRHGLRGRPAWLAGVRSVVHREPFGIVLVIGPGNYLCVAKTPWRGERVDFSAPADRFSTNVPFDQHRPSSLLFRVAVASSAQAGEPGPAPSTGGA